MPVPTRSLVLAVREPSSRLSGSRRLPARIAHVESLIATGLDACLITPRLATR
jgi:hypothetical protein